MQKEYLEQWSNLCSAYGKSLSALTELNTKTLNEFYEKGNACIKNLATAKRPEELMSSQLKFAMDTSACTVDYLQELLSLLKDSSEDLTKHSHEAMKANTAVFSGAKNKATEK